MTTDKYRAVWICLSYRQYFSYMSHRTIETPLAKVFRLESTHLRLRPSFLGEWDSETGHSGMSHHFNRSNYGAKRGNATQGDRLQEANARPTHCSSHPHAQESASRLSRSTLWNEKGKSGARPRVTSALHHAVGTADAPPGLRPLFCGSL